MNNEIWKPVVGFEGLYEVSDAGRVRSLDRVITTRGRWGGEAQRRLRGRALRPRRFSNDYLGVQLCDAEGQKTKLIHRLVAEAFLGDQPEMQVNHKDGVRSHNHIGNLEWATCGDNHRHAHSLHWRKLNSRAIRVAAALPEGPSVFESMKSFVRHLKSVYGFDRSAGSVYSAVDKGHNCCGFPVWRASHG